VARLIALRVNQLRPCRRNISSVSSLRVLFITHVALKSRVVMDGGAAIKDCVAVGGRVLISLIVDCRRDV